MERLERRLDALGLTADADGSALSAALAHQTETEPDRPVRGDVQGAFVFRDGIAYPIQNAPLPNHGAAPAGLAYQLARMESRVEALANRPAQTGPDPNTQLLQGLLVALIQRGDSMDGASKVVQMASALADNRSDALCAAIETLPSAVAAIRAGGAVPPEPGGSADAAAPNPLAVLHQFIATAPPDALVAVVDSLPDSTRETLFNALAGCEAGTAREDSAE